VPLVNIWKLCSPPEPEDDGVAQVPSPRQNVVADADVPLFKLVTERLPVTPVDNGNPVHDVKIPDDGSPIAGVTNIGFVFPTKLPLPVRPVKLFPIAFIVAILFP
jgi:hypothetical protein